MKIFNVPRTLIMMGVLLLGGLSILSSGSWAAGPGENTTQTQESKPPARIEGFRSARFGMTEAEVATAIAKDFAIKPNTILRQPNAIEKTLSLVIAVKNLIPESGRAQVAYIFGFHSKRLMQVNIQWGAPVSPQTAPDKVVATANILRQHFASQAFAKDGLLVNVPLSQENVIVFRGHDDKGRMVILHLTSAQAPQPATDKAPSTQVRVGLRLSYIKDPANPDVFRLEPGKF